MLNNSPVGRSRETDLVMREPSSPIGQEVEMGRTQYHYEQVVGHLRDSEALESASTAIAWIWKTLRVSPSGWTTVGGASKATCYRY